MSKIPCILLAEQPNKLAITQPKFWFGQEVLVHGRYAGVITGMEWVAPRSFWTYNGMTPGWVYTIDFEGDEPTQVCDDDLQLSHELSHELSALAS